MSDETERRIEEARRAAERQKQTAGFSRRAVPLKWRLLADTQPDW